MVIYKGFPRKKTQYLKIFYETKDRNFVLLSFICLDHLLLFLDKAILYFSNIFNIKDDHWFKLVIINKSILVVIIKVMKNCCIFKTFLEFFIPTCDQNVLKIFLNSLFINNLFLFFQLIWMNIWFQLCENIQPEHC